MLRFFFPNILFHHSAPMKVPIWDLWTTNKWSHCFFLWFHGVVEFLIRIIFKMVSWKKKDHGPYKSFFFGGWVLVTPCKVTWLPTIGGNHVTLNHRTRWWFQIFVSPLFRENSHFDEQHIFSNGWFNHQLAKCWCLFIHFLQWWENLRRFFACR